MSAQPHVGIGQGADDFISSTSGPGASFPPMSHVAPPVTDRPDAVYLVPGPHPDCPSCPKSLTRSRRRSLALGETTGLVPETPISTVPSWAPSHRVLVRALEGKHSALMSPHPGHSTPSVPSRVSTGGGGTRGGGAHAYDSCGLIAFRPKLQYVNNDERGGLSTSWGTQPD